MRFQSAVRLRIKVCPRLCKDVLRCRYRQVLICCEVGVEFNVLRVKLRRSVREDCRMCREVIHDLHDEVSARGDNVVRDDVIADSRSEVAPRGDSAVRNEIPADIRRKCSAHVGLIVQRCILSRRKAYVLLRRECSSQCDILARRQYGIRVGMNRTGCLEIPRLRRERNLALARNGIDRQIRLCHSVKCTVGAEILRRDAVRRCGECGLARTCDVVGIDILPLGSQVAARRHIMDLEICTRCDDRVADDAHVIRRDILCLGTQTTARRHIVCREVCTCIQHCIAARRNIVRRQRSPGVQRCRFTHRDILCGQLLVRLNGQRAVRAYIAAHCQCALLCDCKITCHVERRYGHAAHIHNMDTAADPVARDAR